MTKDIIFTTKRSSSSSSNGNNTGSVLVKMCVPSIYYILINISFQMTWVRDQECQVVRVFGHPSSSSSSTSMRQRPEWIVNIILNLNGAVRLLELESPAIVLKFLLVNGGGIREYIVLMAVINHRPRMGWHSQESIDRRWSSRAICDPENAKTKRVQWI